MPYCVHCGLTEDALRATSPEEVKVPTGLAGTVAQYAAGSKTHRQTSTLRPAPIAALLRLRRDMCQSRQRTEPSGAIVEDSVQFHVSRTAPSRKCRPNGFETFQVAHPMRMQALRGAHTCSQSLRKPRHVHRVQMPHETTYDELNY